MTPDPAHIPSETADAALRREVQTREGTRLMMLFFFFAMLAIFAVVRQVVGCDSMQGWALGSRVALLFVGVLYCMRSLQVVSAAESKGRLLTLAYWRVTASIELLLVLAMITATEWLSSRNDIQDLGAPILMMIPLIVVLSILRLRPRMTLWTALGGAGFHAGLSVWTFVRTGTSFSELPTLLSYAVLLVMIGIAGWLVSFEMRAMMLGRIEQRQRDAARGQS